MPRQLNDDDDTYTYLTSQLYEYWAKEIGLRDKHWQRRRGSDRMPIMRRRGGYCLGWANSEDQ